jgi:hypothetical protein
MSESPREKWAGYFGLGVTIIPAMIVSGFMPDWDVLPFGVWLAIASTGAAVAGAIATPKLIRGAIAGGLTGAGILVGVWLYVEIRAWLTGHATFMKLELVIGAILGGTPGFLLFARWARADQPEPAALPDPG